MRLEFPYQIVTFLDKEPMVGEPVYYGANGWYPQLAIKRRFKLSGIEEEQLVDETKKLLDKSLPKIISTGELVKPDRMPVSVIEVRNEGELAELHTRIIDHFASQMISRYPEREGDNYYPHITAEYNDAFVVPVDDIVNNEYPLKNVWLLKDVGDENSLAHVKIL